MLPSEEVALLAVIDPDVTAASTVVSSYVSMAQFHSIMAVISAGTLGASATLDAKLLQATTAAGAGAKDITGKAITQMTQAGTDQSDDQAIINLLAEDLDAANDFDFVALSMTVAVATSDIAGWLLGLHARKGPASGQDAATVGEIVT